MTLSSCVWSGLQDSASLPADFCKFLSQEQKRGQTQGLRAQVKHTVFLLLYIQRIKSKCDWVMHRLLFWSHNCRFETQSRCSVMNKHQKCVVRYQHFEDTLKALTLAVRRELCHTITWIELKENKQIKVPVSVVQPSITHVVVQQQGTLCTTMCQQVFGVEQLSVEDVPGH